MNCRSFPLIVLVSLAASAPFVLAQIAECADAPPGSSSFPCPVDITARRSFDMASVGRGGKIFAAQCASYLLWLLLAVIIDLGGLGGGAHRQSRQS